MGRKISDGKSVRVSVPASTTINTGDFVLLDGYLGLATQSIKTNADGNVTEFKGNSVPEGLVPAEIILNIEEAEYETKQIKTDDTFAVGDKIYWDATNKYFTKTATGNRYAGRVTWADNDNDVIWFLLAPQQIEIIGS